MPFFIRKKTLPHTKPRNKDFKPPPTNRKRTFKNNNKNEDKRPRFNKGNEEIESSSSEEEEGHNSASAEEFDYSSSEETAQEKKIRLAKLYLEEIALKEKDREEEDQDRVGSRLKEDVLLQEGKLRREVAEGLEPDLENVFVLSSGKYLKRSPTCLCISPDFLHIFSGSKDGHIIKWSIKDKSKVGIVKRKETSKKKKKKESDPNSIHTTAITAIAVTSDGKFLASGDLESKIAIWNPETLKRVHVFSGHRSSILGLSFRQSSHTLYSCSADRSVRVWDLDAMGYVEALFGHQDKVTCIDSLTRERILTGGGRDTTIRVWKIVEESQLVYNGHYNGNIDAVKLMNEENFISCSDDGTISTWNVNRKKPLFTLEKAHGLFKSFEDSEISNSNWISSLASLRHTDLVASGSCDGKIRFWKCGEKFKSLSPVFTFDIEGWVNDMWFCESEEKCFLVAASGKEHRMGRWFADFKSAKNTIIIVPFKKRN